jgi:hypothetical protein
MICSRWPAGDSRPGSNSASNRGHLMASRTTGRDNQNPAEAAPGLGGVCILLSLLPALMHNPRDLP